MIPERQVMNSYNPSENQGALERLGIPVQTTPPEQVLTSGKAKSIRFRVSRPHGYSYGDVESYHFDFVIPTLEWYAQTLHQRDLAIHKLGELIDKLEVDLMNAKAQLDNKDYNEAIGLAVEESEKDGELEALLLRVEALQSALNQTQEALEEAQNASFTSPDGEETYTREEVENFLASAVEDANNAKDAHFTTVLAQKDAEFAAQLEEAKVEAWNAAQKEAAQDVEPSGYSEEEVQEAVQSAVHQAVTEAVAIAVAETEQAKDSYYQAILTAKDQELEQAEAKASQVVAPTGYSQDELEEAVAQAVAAKEAEILSQIPEAKSVDQIAELTNEGDLKLRAENKTLRKSVEDLDAYSKQLEEYIESIQGNDVAAAPSTHQVQATTNDGRPLPKLRPEDL